MTFKGSGSSPASVRNTDFISSISSGGRGGKQGREVLRPAHDTHRLRGFHTCLFPLSPREIRALERWCVVRYLPVRYGAERFDFS